MRKIRNFRKFRVRLSVYGMSHSLSYTRVGWKVHRLTMMQWSNLTKCGLYFNLVFPAVHTLLPSVLQRLDSRGIYMVYKLSSRSSKKSPTADMTSSWVRYCLSANVFFHVGEQKIVWWCQIRRIWRVINQFKANRHAQHPLQPQTWVQEHCPGETGLPSSVFQAVSEILFKVLNKLFSVGLSGRKQCS